MRTALRAKADKPINPAFWGYRIMYHQGQQNHCPGCGRSNWLIGRTTAECAFCETSLPLALAMMPVWPTAGAADDIAD